MRAIKNIYNTFNGDNNTTKTIKVKEGETARAVRIFHNLGDFDKVACFVKSEDNKLYELNVDNIIDNSFDIIIKNLNKGKYIAELQAIKNDEILKSANFIIEVVDSIIDGNAEELKEFNLSELILKFKDLATLDVGEFVNSIRVEDNQLKISKRNGEEQNITLPKGFSGDYNDLTNKPKSLIGEEIDANKLIDKVEEKFFHKDAWERATANLAAMSLVRKDRSSVYDEYTPLLYATLNAYEFAEFCNNSIASIAKSDDTLIIRRGSGEITTIELPRGFSGDYNDLGNKPKDLKGEKKSDLMNYIRNNLDSDSLFGFASSNCFDLAVNLINSVKLKTKDEEYWHEYSPIMMAILACAFGVEVRIDLEEEIKRLKSRITALENK